VFFAAFSAALQVAVRAADSPQPIAPTFAHDVLPLVRQYCVNCHGGSRPKAKLALDCFKDEGAVLQDREIWEKVAANLRTGDMPPPNRPRPSADQAGRLVAWIDHTFRSDDCLSRKDPGRVTLRRLNRTDYNNTIRDLVGVAFRPADDFPADDVGYGFDNIGDVLSLSPLLLEKYLAAAGQIVDRAFAEPKLSDRILICRPTGKDEEECARKILKSFARRAYRRPPTDEEIRRLCGFVRLARAQGDSFETGIRLALEAVLTSPHFLFRVERDPKPGERSPHFISEYELASRLSYFLWSTMPDEELLQLADSKALRKNLVAQVRRMLQSPKAQALAENFGGQWLQTRSLRTATPDRGQFPGFDEELRSAMQEETERFFEAILREDRPILDFLDADFTFVNERLARHYGLSGVRGKQMRRVSLAGTPRGGVLTEASVLTVTSNPTRTSPVKRGKWILENILGTPPPPPPPDAGELSEDKQVVLSGSLRQRMEQHRADARCASCHQRMDPLGFGFENFDAVGAWRSHDGRFPVDASGTLPDRSTFRGPAELKGILRSKKEEFARCLAEKLLTYALGRGLEPYDRCAVNDIVANLARDEYRFQALILAVVQSDPFQMRRRARGGK
jgi:hypothetical protein